MVDLYSLNKFYRGSLVRNNQKNKKIEWKKPVVKTYGDAVEIIKVPTTKFAGADDNVVYEGQSIGT